MPKRARRALTVSTRVIEQRIYIVRGEKVMLDSHLAELYRVETSNLNRAVKRNRRRFPDDFMFQLTLEEAESLRFQIGISKTETRGGRRYLPYVFTEQGIAMLSSVLKSTRAIQVNIAIMRAFVQFREILATHKELAYEVRRIGRLQKEQGENIGVLWQAIQQLLEPAPAPPKRRIGYPG